MKRTFFGLACVLAISLLFTPRAHAAGTDNAARAAIVVHPETGAVLYEKNADERLGIASTTKIMTALVVLEHCALEEPVEILPEYTAVEGSSMYLRAGETYTVEELLYGLMLVSGNDAAIALACHTAGSVAAFAGMMNDKTRALGMTSSAFQNPNGLDAEGHYSTARDMAKLACAALENETFRAIVSTKSTTVDGQTLVNHNRLLRSYDGAVGVKTGYTKTAGRTLVSCAQRGTTQFVCVTLSDPDDWNDHTHLLDWAFENYAYRAVAGDTPVYAVPVLSGTVQEINMTYTRLATFDNKLISIPNSAVVAAQIVNYSAADTRRVDIPVSASYDAPTQKVIDALVQAGTMDNVLLTPAPSACVSSYGDSAIAYTLRVWVKTEDYWDVYFALTQRVKDVFDEQGIAMTYPHLNVHLDK